MAAVTICSDFGAQKNKAIHCFHCFPIYFPWSDGTRCQDLSFLNVVLANVFTLLFHFHKRLFNSSSLSAIREVSSAYLSKFILRPLVPMDWVLSAQLVNIIIEKSSNIKERNHYTYFIGQTVIIVGKIWYKLCSTVIPYVLTFNLKVFSLSLSFFIFRQESLTLFSIKLQHSKLLVEL